MRSRSSLRGFASLHDWTAWQTHRKADGTTLSTEANRVHRDDGTDRRRTASGISFAAWFGFWSLLVLAVSGCGTGTEASSHDEGIFRLVRFVEVRGPGNIAVVSEGNDGRLVVTQSGLATWFGGDVWLLGRRRVFALLDGEPVVGNEVCPDAADILHTGSYVLVSCPQQAKLEVYDGRSLAWVQSLDICEGASQMAAVPSGRTVFVRCRQGLAVVAGWVPAMSSSGRNLVLLSDDQGLTALSEEGFFVWSYPGIPQVGGWAVTEPNHRTIMGVGRRVSVTGDPAVQGDAEYTVELDLAELSFGVDLMDVKAVQAGLNVRELARSRLGNTSWDSSRRQLLVPLPGAGRILALSPGCIGHLEHSPRLYATCGLVSSLPGRPGAVLASRDCPVISTPLVWDRDSQTLWRLKDGRGEIFHVFASPNQ